MPYSNDERDQLEFYQEFVDDLRDDYTKKVKRFFPTFRDSDNIMYSYEDILTGLGLEDANIEDPLHSFLYELDFSKYTTAELQKAKIDPDIRLVPDIRDRRFNQYTINAGKQKKYIKNQNLDKILDRNINELSEDLIAEELPPGIENGDFVTNRLADDLRKWLITGNQKRIFPDLATFYGYGGLGAELKLLSDTQLNSIPDGEPIE